MSFSWSILGGLNLLKQKTGVLGNMIQKTLFPTRNLYTIKIQKEQLKAGDHIYTWRNFYSYTHHGIYVGDGDVIHLTRAPGLLLYSSSESHPTGDRVERCSVEKFLAGGDDLYLFEYGVKLVHFLMKPGGTCTTASSDPSDHVLRRASFLVEYGYGDYNLFQNNCEDFALYCKTGLLDFTVTNGEIAKRGTSGQIGFIWAAIVTLLFIPYRLLPYNSFTALAVVACGLYGVLVSICDVALSSAFEKVAAEKFDPISYQPTIRDQMEKARRRHMRRGLSDLLVGILMYTFVLFQIWSWTPQTRILQFIKLDSFATALYCLVNRILGNFGLEVRYYYCTNIITLVCFAICYYEDILVWLVSSL